MAMLNKAGFPSNRNLSKPFRHQRFDPVKNQIVPLDNMRLGASGQAVNTTGCFGTPSTYGVRVYIPGPKQGRRRDFHKKKPSRLVTTRELFLDKTKRIQMVRELRGKLLTLEIIGLHIKQDLLGYLRAEIPKLNDYLVQTLSKEEFREMFRQDEQRRKSIQGQMKSGQLHKIRLRDIKNAAGFICSNLK